MNTPARAILIVDDDATNRTLLSTYLQDEGYDVAIAEDGRQALDMLQERIFDVVLLDLVMPRVNGFQVLEQMKAESRLEYIPVIVISSQDDMESIGRCLQMGATDYVPKPFEPVLLRARVNTSLAMRRLYEQEQAYTGKFLVVDDDMVNRTLLATNLEERGFQVEVAVDGEQALEKLRVTPFDVVLLDLVMPNMNGLTVLEHLKADSVLHHIPVIVVSSKDDMESVVRCIERGAADYLTKPVEPAILQARVNASLAAKRLHDQERAYFTLIEAERQKSERLLLNTLPKPIADRLKQGEHVIADSFPDVTVLFADLVGFTSLSEAMSPHELVMLLNDVFSLFDHLAEQHGLEKIKTIGDAYMAVAGVPTPRPDHTSVMAEMALEMQRSLRAFNQKHNRALHMRIGLHTGPVVAGVIGARKFSYDLWGDTVNVASRMESHGVIDAIQVTETIYERLKERYRFEERGEIDIKGKGRLKTYVLLG